MLIGTNSLHYTKMDNSTLNLLVMINLFSFIRMQVYATNNEELEIGFRSTAAPLTLLDRTVIENLSIGGFASCFHIPETAIERSVDLL